VTPDNPVHSPLVWLVMVLSLFQIVYLYREARKVKRLTKGGNGRTEAARLEPLPSWSARPHEQ
jgi:hypothetical protein